MTLIIKYNMYATAHIGALGSKYYSCYDVDNAMSITKSGQTAIKEMLRYVNEKLKSFANAMSITKSGQTAIKEMLRYVNEKLKSFANTNIINFVIARRY